IPADIPVNTMELSTVFANALENAIHAVNKLPQEQRVIRCKCISQPQLMFYVSNPYAGTVQFDENNRPIAETAIHGIGTQSIAAYCDKYDAVCRYSTENGWFNIRIAQTIWTE
ncbi:MAG: GHKL domain-containing protein, partial [Anaerotignum sp.]|nr:GHKL domain-containing protein [Anaerotignum sp.]